jgi:hypothetical protein
VFVVVKFSLFVFRLFEVFEKSIIFFLWILLKNMRMSQQFFVGFTFKRTDREGVCVRRTFDWSCWRT